MTQLNANPAPKQGRPDLFDAFMAPGAAAPALRRPVDFSAAWPDDEEDEAAASPAVEASTVEEGGEGENPPEVEAAEQEATPEASRSGPAPETVPFGRTAEKRGSRPILVVRPLVDSIADAAAKPAPRRIFGDLWFEGELSILFAETNVGKSILAVQIADAITAGRGEVAGQVVEVAPQEVLYLDFELSPQQFHGRYSEDYGPPFPFDPRFLRAEVPRDFDYKGNWTEAIHASIEATVEETGARILIVDNLTALQDETEQAKGALPLMRFLNTLKKRHGLSMLVQAHTPKRDASRPLTGNDLAGSRVILNLCDSAFVIGASHREPPLRYLKQIKVRETEFTLDGSRVALLRLNKPGGFLSFTHEGYGSEADHLATEARTGTRRERAAEWLVNFLADGPRSSVIEKGKEAGHSRNALFEAAEDLGIKPRKLGYGVGEGWEWALPPQGGDQPNSAILPKSTVSEGGDLRDASAGGDGVAASRDDITVTASPNEPQPVTEEGTHD